VRTKTQPPPKPSERRLADFKICYPRDELVTRAVHIHDLE
jgi:hypothetical protein